MDNLGKISAFGKTFSYVGVTGPGSESDHGTCT